MPDGRGRGGRKYSAQVHKTVVKAMREGRTKNIAAALIGVHPDSLAAWLSMGRDQPDRYPEYAQLRADVEKAMAEYAAEALDRIQAAAKADPRNWTADAWYLERTRPEDFSKRDKVEIETSTPLVQINALVLSDSETRDQARSLLQRVAGSSQREVIEGKAIEVSDDD